MTTSVEEDKDDRLQRSCQQVPRSMKWLVALPARPLRDRPSLEVQAAWCRAVLAAARGVRESRMIR